MADAPPPVRIGPREAIVLARLPDVDDPIEALVAAANHRRLDDAIQRVEAVFGSLATLDSLDQPEVTTLAAAGLDGDAVLAAIDEHLVVDDCVAPRIELLGDDAQHVEIPCRNAYELVRPDLGAVARHLEAGFAMSVRAMDAYEPVLGDLAADIETITGAVCVVDALLCGPGSNFTDAPASPLQRLLLVIDGTVEVEVSGIGSTELSVTAGQVLRVPADADVIVRAHEHSVLLRVPIPHPTLKGLRDVAAVRAHYHPLLRADVPASLDAPVSSYGGSLYDRPGDFAAEAARALAGDGLDTAVATNRSVLRPRPDHDPISVLTDVNRDDLRLRSRVPGGVMVATSHDGEVLLAAGHQLHVAPDVVHDLAPLLDGRPFVRQEVCASAAAPERLAAAIAELTWLDLFEVLPR